MSSSRSTDRHAAELADAALDHPPGTALVCELGRSPAVLAATPHRYGALVGLSCPVTIDAVAASHEAVLSVNGRRRDVMLGVAVMRAGPCVARFRAGPADPCTLRDLIGPLVDVGRRALGLATPPCERTPLDLLDAAFIESVLDMLLDADLGSNRPTWIDLGPSHPLSGFLAITPTELCRRRFDVAAISWSKVRHRIIDHVGYPDPERTPAIARSPDPERTPATARSPDPELTPATARSPDPELTPATARWLDLELTPATARWLDLELTPAVARWLDNGSLARWLLARYPEPAQMLDDVCEPLDPPPRSTYGPPTQPSWRREGELRSDGEPGSALGTRVGPPPDPPRRNRPSYYLNTVISVSLVRPRWSPPTSSARSARMSSSSMRPAASGCARSPATMASSRVSTKMLALEITASSTRACRR